MTYHRPQCQTTIKLKKEDTGKEKKLQNMIAKVIKPVSAYIYETALPQEVHGLT